MCIGNSHGFLMQIRILNACIYVCMYMIITNSAVMYIKRNYLSHHATQVLADFGSGIRNCVLYPYKVCSLSLCLSSKRPPHIRANCESCTYSCIIYLLMHRHWQIDFCLLFVRTIHTLTHDPCDIRLASCTDVRGITLYV